MNTSGWLLLSVLFSLLLLLYQRSEAKRRRGIFILIAFVGVIIWRYALYRMANDCYSNYSLVCKAGLIDAVPLPIRDLGVAGNTILAAMITAVIFNILFWVLIGRSNPVGSSDDVIVLGKDD